MGTLDGALTIEGSGYKEPHEPDEHAPDAQNERERSLGDGAVAHLLRQRVAIAGEREQCGDADVIDEVVAADLGVR